MPYVLQVCSGLDGFLAEMRDGTWVRAQSAINGLMWESIDDLRAWVATLTDEQVTRLDDVAVIPVEIDLDVTGCVPVAPDPPPMPPCPAPARRALPPKPARPPNPTPTFFD
jgi:hypothetical protein